jgi:hypothetical protein
MPKVRLFGPEGLMSRGALVISLDFEMAWGYRRSPVLGPRGAQLLRGTRAVVTRLLDIFDRYDVSATWATVGHLMMRPDDFDGGRFDYNWRAPDKLDPCHQSREASARRGRS